MAKHSPMKKLIRGFDVEKLNASVNLDEYMNVDADIKAQTFGSSVHADIDSNDSRQIINIETDSLDLAEIIPLIPSENIPDGIEISGGIVSDANISIEKRGEKLKFGGNAKIKNGSVTVEQTQIDDINGSANFNNDKILIDAGAQANGQHADVNGTIRLDTDEIYFDLNASSDSFNPNAIMYLPAEGVASFNAHLSGTPNNPIVEADIYSPLISYDDLQIYLSDVSTH